MKSKTKIFLFTNKNIFIYHIGYMTVKNLSFVKMDSANHLYRFIGKINGYIEESNENKFLR